jgi:CarD family transcriptional regulator
MAARKKSTRNIAKPSGAKSRSTSRASVTRKRDTARSKSGRKRVGVQAKAASAAKSAAQVKAAAAARKRKAAQKAGAKPSSKAAAARSAKSAAKAARLRAKVELKKPAELKKTKSRAPTAVKPAESPGVKPSVKQAEGKLQAKPDVRPEAATAANAKATAPVARALHASPPGTAAKATPAIAREPKVGTRDEGSRAAKPTGSRHGFKLNEFVVYPAHGVGQIVAVEEQEVAGFRLELFVINFVKDKMTLRVPTAKVAGVGMRKISDPEAAKRSLDILTGRARIKRTMWSRRAQEYESKINSGDINAIAEVVRDLYRSEAQPEQSYSERQLYEAALDRMVREIAAVNKSNEIDALKAVEAQLQKSNRGTKTAPSPSPSEPREPEIEEAA